MHYIVFGFAFGQFVGAMLAKDDTDANVALIAMTLVCIAHAIRGRSS